MFLHINLQMAADGRNFMFIPFILFCLVDMAKSKVVVTITPPMLDLERDRYTTANMEASVNVSCKTQVSSSVTFSFSMIQRYRPSSPGEVLEELGFVRYDKGQIVEQKAYRDTTILVVNNAREASWKLVLNKAGCLDVAKYSCVTSFTQGKDTYQQTGDANLTAKLKTTRGITMTFLDKLLKYPTLNGYPRGTRVTTLCEMPIASDRRAEDYQIEMGLYWGLGKGTLRTFNYDKWRDLKKATLTFYAGGCGFVANMNQTIELAEDAGAIHRCKIRVYDKFSKDTRIPVEDLPLYPDTGPMHRLTIDKGPGSTLPLDPDWVGTIETYRCWIETDLVQRSNYTVRFTWSSDNLTQVFKGIPQTLRTSTVKLSPDLRMVRTPTQGAFVWYGGNASVSVTWENRDHDITCKFQYLGLEILAHHKLVVAILPNRPVITGPKFVARYKNHTWVCSVNGSSIRPQYVQMIQETGPDNIVNEMLPVEETSYIDGGINKWLTTQTLTLHIPKVYASFTLKCEGGIKHTRRPYIQATTYSVTVDHSGADACDSSPCKHRGTCQEQVKSYSCICSEHARGTNCEIETPGELNVDCPVYLREGITIVCNCTSERRGTPPAKVGWRLPSEHSRSVTVFDVNRFSKEAYTCEMVWEPPDSQPEKKTIMYPVQAAWGPADKDTTIQGPSSARVEDFEKVNLTCQSTSVSPTPLVKWSGVTCEGGNSQQTCTFLPEPVTSFLSITCQLTSKAFADTVGKAVFNMSITWDGKTRVVYFNVNSRASPYTVLEADKAKRLRLECKVLGDPDPDINVYKLNGNMDVGGGGILLTSANSSEQAGQIWKVRRYQVGAPNGSCTAMPSDIYRCDANNAKSSDSKQLTITLKCSDEIVTESSGDLDTAKNVKMYATIGGSVLGSLLLLSGMMMLLWRKKRSDLYLQRLQHRELLPAGIVPSAPASLEAREMESHSLRTETMEQTTDKCVEECNVDKVGELSESISFISQSTSLNGDVN